MTEILRDKGGFWSPTIRKINHDGRPAVVKDYRTKNLLTRTLLAPKLVRREFAILRHLEGVPGIPRAYAMVAGPALVTEYIEGRHLSKFKPGELPDSFFRAFQETVTEMHGRGVVHLDLRQRKNILVADRPWLVDFANAMRLRPGALLRALIGVDQSGLLKFKGRHWPHLLTAADRAFLKRHHLMRRFWIFSPHRDRERDMVW